MRGWNARRWLGLGLAAAVAIGTTALTIPVSAAADSATIYLVQGLPGKTVSFTIDGKTVLTNQKSGAISQPLKVASGKRRITVTAGGATVVDQMVTVGPDWIADVVVHLPSDPNGKPVMTTYKDDLSWVSGGKASLTVAHTAAVPAADIRVNGKVLFSNIANGQSLHVVVPVATYSVAIVPTGKSKPVYFGPVDLTVQGGKLNAVYAIGNPGSKTMNVVVHVLNVSQSSQHASAKPHRVNTGSGGQAIGAHLTELPALIR